jgi:hypothetical protein
MKYEHKVLAVLLAFVAVAMGVMTAWDAARSAISARSAALAAHDSYVHMHDELTPPPPGPDPSAIVDELDAALFQVNMRLRSLEDVAEKRDERIDAAERRIWTLFQGGECQFDMESGHHAETVAYERQLEVWGNQVADVVNLLQAELAGVRQCKCGCRCGCKCCAGSLP